MKLFLSERIVSTVTLILIGAALFVASLDARSMALDPAFSSTFFPRIILMLWVGLALLDLVTEFMQRRASEPVRLVPVAILVVAVLTYVMSLMTLGFFICSVAFALVALPALGQRNPVTVALYAVVVPGAIVLVFNHMLKMPLPSSPFVWWL
jgi:hypothetical protein